MNPFDALVVWLGETPDIADRVLEHVGLSLASVVAASTVAIPVGLYIGHTRRFEAPVVNAANLGRAIPAFAIIALSLPVSIRLGLGLGFWPSFVALFLLAIPPVLTNTYVGVKEVERDAVEASRGMGMSDWELLRRVELPLAGPLIVTGLRTSTVQVIATAPLAALVAGPGLGNYIVLGFRAGDPGSLWGGALLVAGLALGTEALFGWIDRIVTARAAPGQRRPRGRFRRLGEAPRPGAEGITF